MASEYPFKRVLGIELSETLHKSAVINIQRYRSRTQKCHDVQSVLENATDYSFPPGPLVIYLFNSLKEKVLANVLQRLEESTNELPRHMILVYFYPAHKRLLDKLSFLEPVPFEDQLLGPVRKLMPVHRQHYDQPWVAIYETHVG
jgi:hypothetical protein